MKARTGPRLAWAIFAIVTLGLASTIAFSVFHAAGPQEASEEGAGAGAVLGIAMFTFPVVGVLVASRQPRNAIGWILLAIGVAWDVVGGFGSLYAQFGLLTNPGSVPGAAAAAVLASSVWAPGIGLMTFFILLFPNGRFPSRGWLPLAWVCGLTVTALWLALVLAPGNLREITGDASMPTVSNPLGVEAFRSFNAGPIFFVVAMLPICFLGCALSLVRRFRRSHGRERQQLKWLAAAGGLTASLFVASIGASFVTGQVTESTGASQPLWLTILDSIALFSFVLIPIAMGIAILRHRLYDIDLIINRALVYGALTAILVGTYAVIATLAGTIVGGSEIATAGATLSVAGLFQPLRRRIQGFIDKRFYRRKYDASQTVDAFSSRLRDEVNVEAMRLHLVEAVHETMQPRRVSVWLRG
jgi:hypothetical protein